jgi:hypothetical protein
MWIDPGGMTGIATLEGGRTFHADEYPFQMACEYIEAWCMDYRGALHIGYEKFTILPGTHKLSPQPEAYELPGVVRYVATRNGSRLLSPAAPGDRSAATPEMLKAIGWWVPGKDDAQSASQHLLAFLLREHCVPPHLATLLAQLH